METDEFSVKGEGATDVFNPIDAIDDIAEAARRLKQQNHWAYIEWYWANKWVEPERSLNPYTGRVEYEPHVNICHRSEDDNFF